MQSIKPLTFSAAGHGDQQYRAGQALAEDRLGRIANLLEQGSIIEHVEGRVIAERISQNGSHLPNAIRLDPETDPRVFLRDYGRLLEANEVVFYCSTGRRSTALAEQVAQTLDRDGRPNRPVNMKGGIFQWHNESRPLVNANGSTGHIHPYNWYWKRLLRRNEMVRY